MGVNFRTQYVHRTIWHFFATSTSPRPQGLHVSFYFPLYSLYYLNSIFQYFNDYYTSEHARLLALWRDVVEIKRSFTTMQSATEQDLSRIRSELNQSTRQMSGACNGLVAISAGSNVATAVSTCTNKVEYFIYFYIRNPPVLMDV